MYEGLNMVKNRLLKLILSILCLSLVLCGCDKKNEAESVEKKTSVTLQMRLTESFDPLKAEHRSVRDALSLCYEPLFTLNDKMLLEGVLADSITVSQDCMSAIVTVKNSVVWHDGISFTSADVVHSINLIKENTDSPYYECVKNIDSVQALDPYSLKINLKKPYGQIAYSLYFPIVASHNTALDDTIIGTGPYVFANYSAAVSLEFTENTLWHGGEVNCKKITVLMMRDEDTATSSFNSGSVNVITDYSYDFQNNTPKSTTNVITYPSLQYEFLAFNHSRSIFSSQAIRSAVSCAIDRSAIVEEVYPSKAHPANTPAHPVANEMSMASVGSQYNLSNALETLFLEGYSINENTGILQNGNGEKLTFTLLVNRENNSRVMTAQILRSQLFLAGIEVNIRELDFETYLSEIEAGNYDAYLGGAQISNMYDFEAFFAPGAKLNNFRYTSEYMNAALSELANASTDDMRATAIVSFEEIFLREQPLCGLVFKNDNLMVSESIFGELTPYPDMPYKNIDKWIVE